MVLLTQFMETADPSLHHRSVLYQEVLDMLNPSGGGTFVDATFGGGGHANGLLEKGATKVVGIDRDDAALNTYREVGKFKDDPRLELWHGRFSAWAAGHAGAGIKGVVADLGVSTRQLLESHRGFSFAREGPIDMRMDQKEDRNLIELLQTHSALEVSQEVFENTGWWPPKQVMEKLIEAAQNNTLKTTLDIANLFEERHSARHPATRLFLGLRMCVNQELTEISEGLPAFLDCLAPGGRLAVITFHSTEDRMVKRIFKQWEGKCVCKIQPCLCKREKKVRWLSKKPIEPSRAEQVENPRSRSAKLRCIEKLPSSP